MPARPLARILGLPVSAAWLSAAALWAPASAAEITARGVVFEDADGDGRRGFSEIGLPEVRVSNGRDIALTDSLGRYALTLGDEGVLFVVKPSGWRAPVDGNMLPRFYYLHKPAGSPPSRFTGVAPTGALPYSVDFPLTRQDEPESFTVLVFGDTQTRNPTEISYLAHDVVEEVIGSDAAFGVTLGDILFDDLSHYESLARVVAKIGIPWHNVIGNHDLNFDSSDDAHADETFERYFGPPYYSFDVGQVHFVVLDDVLWQGEVEDASEYQGGNYDAGLGERQLAWLERDLALTGRERLVVLMMHIPFSASNWQPGELEQLFRLLEKRPRCLSLAAHYHTMEHDFLDAQDGWRGARAHHQFIAPAVCGSWWSGAPDETGIPHSTMRDGAPNGYALLRIDGADYRLRFKAARRPAEYQMNLMVPDRVSRDEAGETELLVNVFAGSERSVVEYRFGDEGEWRPMKRVPREDPLFATMKEAEEGENPPPGRKLPKAGKSPHIWQALLPANPPAGTHRITVRETDCCDAVHRGERIHRVEGR